VERNIVDWVLGITNVAAILVCAFVAIYLPRRLAHSDGQAEEIARQGSKLNRHAYEIRNIHDKSGIKPLNPDWDIQEWERKR
jgi:hypothetical protein